MLKRLFTPGRTRAFEAKIPAVTTNAWVPFEGSNYGLPMEPGTYAVTIMTTPGVELPLGISTYVYEGQSYDWVEFTGGVAVRLHWKSTGELRFRCTSEKGGYVTVLVTPVTNSLSLSLVDAFVA